MSGKVVTIIVDLISVLCSLQTLGDTCWSSRNVDMSSARPQAGSNLIWTLLSPIWCPFVLLFLWNNLLFFAPARLWMNSVSSWVVCFVFILADHHHSTREFIVDVPCAGHHWFSHSFITPSTSSLLIIALSILFLFFNRNYRSERRLERKASFDSLKKLLSIT